MVGCVYPFFNIRGVEMFPAVYIKRIKEYEHTNNKNILELFSSISINNLLELFNAFYNWDEEKSCEFLDNSFEKGIGLYEIYIELKNALLGYKDINNESCREVDEEDEEREDLTQYKYLSDWYLKVGTQLMSMGLTYTEFWNLSTAEMYTVYEAFQTKYINDINKQIELDYIAASMQAAAVWGKPLSEAPKISLKKPEETIIHTDKYGDLSLDVYKSVKALEKLGGGLRDE